jgi:hypothetical protein
MNLTAAPIDGGTGTEVSWTDASDNETEFRVYRRDGVGPDFVLVGVVATTDMLGTGGVGTFQDLMLAPMTTYAYRVTAFGPDGGESVPSNEALIDTSGAVPPTRWLDVQLGRRSSIIIDRRRARADRVLIRGSYAVIDVDISIPSVLHDADPRVDGIAIQVRAPSNLVLVSIPANDPRWNASRSGVYRWNTRDGRRAPASSIRINTRKSEFTFKSNRNEFGSIPGNFITVSFTTQKATGSDTRVWNAPGILPSGIRAMFKHPKFRRPK